MFKENVTVKLFICSVFIKMSSQKHSSILNILVMKGTVQKEEEFASSILPGTEKASRSEPREIQGSP